MIKKLAAHIRQYKKQAIATPLFIVCISLCETVSRQRDVASNPRNQRV